MFIRQGTEIPSAEKLTELKELDYVSKIKLICLHFLLKIDCSFCQLRDEIIENFENFKNMPFCESDWKKLRQWRWNENITDDKAQTLTSRVRIHCTHTHTSVKNKQTSKSIHILFAGI